MALGKFVHLQNRRGEKLSKTFNNIKDNNVVACLLYVTYKWSFLVTRTLNLVFHETAAWFFFPEHIPFFLFVDKILKI